jgi:hypothetical protein
MKEWSSKVGWDYGIGVVGGEACKVCRVLT